MLDLFELDPNKKIKQLSKGMRVKLSLVLAVAHEPDVLLLDEPMAGLDPLAREEFLDGVLRTICERGQTIIFSTHSLDDVQRLADTLGILYDGCLLVHRNIEELLATTKRIRATLLSGHPPERLPENILWQRVQGREWLVTVSDFSLEKVQQIQAQEGVEHVEANRRRYNHSMWWCEPVIKDLADITRPVEAHPARWDSLTDDLKQQVDPPSDKSLHQSPPFA